MIVVLICDGGDCVEIVDSKDPYTALVYKFYDNQLGWIYPDY